MRMLRRACERAETRHGEEVTELMNFHTLSLRQT